MPVVINEFDVASQEPAKQTGSASSGPSSSSAQAPKPEDIEHAMRRQLERLTRIRAH